MNRRRLWASLLGTVIVVVGALAINLALGYRPVLGLDLQGGVSVILAPTEGAADEDLLVIRDLVRDSLEQSGIGEPDVRVEGSNVVVDLPGVKDQQQALEVANVAGIVTLRPVLACGAAPVDGGAATSVPGSTPPTGTATGTTTPTTGSSPATGSVPATTAAPAATAAPSATTGGAGGPGEARPLAARSASPPTTVPSTPPASTPPASTVPGSTVPGSAPGTSVPVAAPTDGTAILPTIDGGFCQLGPTGGTGEVFVRNGARTDIVNGEWTVLVDLSADGEVSWNNLASQCFNAAPTCPSRQLAIVLDDIVQSYPVVQAESFSGTVTISGSFEESEARSLTRVLNRGAFPVPVEAQSVETVSPTLGSDSLRAAVIAGLVGIVLVLLYMIIFYRSLTVLVAAGMTVWAMMIYSVSAFISQTTNFALTLAGVTGIIISVGVTVDSYVVYFERLKDEERHGRSIKNSAERAFKATWRTILAADLVAMIGAAVLFVLSVGSVRGFALYLGVTTACDLVVCYFFTRPAVILTAQTGRLDRHDPFGLETTTR